MTNLLQHDKPYIFVLEMPLAGLILEMTKSDTDMTNIGMLIIWAMVNRLKNSGLSLRSASMQNLMIG